VIQLKVREAASLDIERLLDHYRPMILSIVRASYISNLSADDMIQELRVVLWKCHERAKAGLVRNRSFDTYLHLAMLNRLIDLTRSAARKPAECPLEDAGDPSDNSYRMLADVEFRVHLESVPMSGDAKLLVGLILADTRDFRDAFLQRAGRGGRTRYPKAKEEIAQVLAQYGRKEVMAHAGSHREG